jgi:hypothetical protein
MSDDGTQAAKKIAYCVQLEGCLVQADYLVKQLREWPWNLTQEKELRDLGEKLESMLSTARVITESFYKVIGEF